MLFTDITGRKTIMTEVRNDLKNKKYLTIVEESYFGKQPEFRKCEALLAVMIEKINGNTSSRKFNPGISAIDAAVATYDLDNCKENIELQKLLCKVFGFSELYLRWGHDPNPNAFTTGRSVLKWIDSDMPKSNLKQSNGKYYDKDHGYICFVEVEQSLIKCGLTPGECMAIILHEIGHNFQCAPVCNIVPLLEIYELASAIMDYLHKYHSFLTVNIGLLQFSGVFDPATALLIRVAQWLHMEFRTEVYTLVGRIEALICHNIPFLGKLLSITNLIAKIWQTDIFNICPIMIQPFLIIASMTKAGMFAPEEIAIKFAFGQIGYAGEVFADSFATAYGYGPETASAQEKMETKIFIEPSNSLGRNNPIHSINEFIFVSWTMLLALLDPHPMTQTRIVNQVDKLRKEIDSGNYPPKLKKALHKDLDRTQKIYDNYVNMDPAFQHLFIITAFRKINENLFNGKIDMRNFINSVLNFGHTEA